MEKVRGFENVTGSTVKLPIRKTESSAGYDFIAPHDIVVPARGSSNVVFTGIKAYMRQRTSICSCTLEVVLP